ncbi:MAG: protein kinase [Pirellulaceae bacterium]|nr:protein kinase [Pirellulaceae bacterium]
MRVCNQPSSQPTKPPASPIEASISEVLLNQNHYQRLGFSNMSATAEQVEQAYRNRMDLLAASVTTPADRQQSAELIEASFQCLSNTKLRRRYDRTLTGQSSSQHKAGESLFLGRYKIGESISRGERAAIYSARDTRLNRDVVVKRIATELLRDETHRSSMRAEAELFASFNSSHLVKILDYDIDSGATVMERMATSLQSIATPSGLPSDRVQSMIEQALHGLNALHNSGITHGRLDPSHLLLDDFDCVKLSLTPGLSGVTAALQPGACARHLAPEMLNSGVFGQPTVAVDLYALGFVALELLAGKHFAKRVNQGIAFKGGDLQSWLLWHSSSTDYLPNIADLVPDIHPGFAAVLEKMTNKDQRERYSTAAECLAALAALQTVNPVPESMPTLRDEETEINLLGTPPQLETVYTSHSTVHWSDIVKKPSLLLQPAARNHALMVGVAVLAVLTLSVLSSNSAPTEPVTVADASSEADPANELANFDDSEFAASEFNAPNEFKGDSELGVNDELNTEFASRASTGASDQADKQHSILENKEVMVWSVKFSVDGGGRVESVDGDRSSEDQAWPLQAGEHRVKFRSSKANTDHEVKVVIPQGHGNMLCSLVVPVAESPQPAVDTTQAPPAEDIGRSFNAVDFEFPVVGAANLPQAELQTAHLKNLFKTIASEPHKAHKLVQSLVLPSYPVDPRFAFAHAIVAKRRGDIEATRKYCNRAIADARHFGVAFIPAVMLLSRVHVESNHSANALAECRATLADLKRKTNIRETQVDQAIGELAWWTGVLVGYMESVHNHNQLEHPDVSHTCSVFETACSAEQWGNFRIGRTHVIRQAAHLRGALDEFNAEYSAAKEENRLIRLQRYEELGEKKDKSRFASQSMAEQPHTYSQYPEYDSLGLVNKNPRPEVARTSQVPHELPKYDGLQPHAFRTYIPNDSTVLAERTLNSIAVPSESYFVSTN